MTRKWFSRRRSDEYERDPIPLIVALDGFLSAGSSSVLAAEHLRTADAEVVHEFDLDSMLDYRARRPPITFRRDHYVDYVEPVLQITRHRDRAGTPYLLLAGPEPDFGWEAFAAETIDVISELGVPLTVGLGGVPMGVPHTRPPLLTMHGTRPELVDRKNFWNAEVSVPSSAQSLLEYRMREHGLDAIGYVVHVPHYLAQVEYPTAALALLEAVGLRLGLDLDLEELRARQPESITEIEQQIAEQDGEQVLHGLEEQYDIFSRGAAESLLADDASLPTGDELASQLEQFLARQRKDDQG
ncbi:PAC2 family protein [Aeromicrobium tamlense]|uniref:PAC2 family protein n=1 Tax=Aeromicrobium tamlense TaxID=375541 RepID=A0A8I0FZP3_9ACTN|nr:PAC2 family protein [Aeromicrobium tamlense]MBD1270882.1 PAC2 family protein [Aeromicrobium tamlense]NYI38273.1 proteasome assembly chaperone (PAC2) family protein [Aeromicrobium tamlense]